MNRKDAAALASCEGDGCARSEPAARADEGAKGLGVGGFWKEVEDFGAPATAGLPKQACRQDAASVDDEQVSGLELGRKVGKGTVVDGAALSVKGQKAGGVPIRERLLRDQTRREVEVEVLSLQKSFF